VKILPVGVALIHEGRQTDRPSVDMTIILRTQTKAPKIFVLYVCYYLS